MKTSRTTKKSFHRFLAVLVVCVFVLLHAAGCKKKQTHEVSNKKTSAPTAAPTATPIELKAPVLTTTVPQQGASDINQPLPQLAPPPPLIVPKIILNTSCFTVTFHHKGLSKHSDDEDCAKHKNIIHIDSSEINPKSICVRVDGAPVAHHVIKKNDGKAGCDLLIAGVAGPKSKITAQYCLNGGGCKEDCSIPKDEFMDAIAATKGKAPVARWEKSDQANAAEDANRDFDVAKDLDVEIIKELDEAGTTSVFSDWLRDQESESCTTTKTKGV